jgi:CheY-like chemotaxis protein
MPADHPTPSPRQARVPRILIVDDEPAIREVLSAVLTEEGYEVAVAVDGAEGLTRVAEHSPDLVILDYMMPRLDGLQLLQRLRSRPELAKAHVILLSAVAHRLRGEPLASSVDLVLAKPFDLDELVDHVAAVLKRARTDGDAG